jgi:hypothetical protein
MAEVSPQTQYPYCSDHREVSLEVATVASLQRTVVDEEDLDGVSRERNGFIKPPNEFCSGGPIVSERHEHYKM